MAAAHIHRVGGEPAHLDNLARIALSGVQRPFTKVVQAQVTESKMIYGGFKQPKSFCVRYRLDVIRLPWIPEETAQCTKVHMISRRCDHGHPRSKVKPLQETVGLVTSPAYAFKNDRRRFLFHRVPQ